jgi:hypothetical protein
MLNPKRLEMVKARWWDSNLCEERYGIKLWDEPSVVLASFRVWAEGHCRDPQVIKPDAIDHWRFETFLQHRELIPERLASIQLGMSQESFRKMLELMSGETLITPAEEKGNGQGIYSSNFIRDIYMRFAGLQRRVFGSHTGYIQRLHATIAAELGFKPEAQFCITSLLLKEDPPVAAYEYDILTNEPIGIRYQSWLDFGKPLNLKPDACSLVTLVKNYDLLQPFSMGTIASEDLPLVRNAMREQGSSGGGLDVQ